MSLKRFGVVETVIAPLSYFTPVLVVLFGSVSGLCAHSRPDRFVGITVYAVWRERAIALQGEEC